MTPSPVGIEAGTKGDRTRRRILDAAAAEISRCGVDGTSLRAVADAAGLKAGSLYFHFGSKDELVAAVLDEGVRASLRRLEAAVAAVADGTPADRLRAAVGAHLGALADLRDYAVAVLAPQFLGEAGRDRAFRALRRRYLDHWARLIADAQGAGAVASGAPPRVAARLIVGALNGTALDGTRPAQAAAGLEALLHLTP